MLHSCAGGEYPQRRFCRQYGPAGGTRRSGRPATAPRCRERPQVSSTDRGRSLRMDVPLWLWLAVLGGIVAMLAVDLFA
ncbi:hypothetical protein E9549_22655, partial [Blastococcus sp. MG754426]|nr:hypothetical protein [Blastococcus sp. MG754426]MCF6514537.1 hypothetical protein [Blastococcus sp. MG754427]MCF6746603.1 hypothetical protein [Blastococcus sp. KM273128]